MNVTYWVTTADVCVHMADDDTTRRSLNRRRE